MTKERYNYTIASIMAMDHLVHGFNDEEFMESWFINGVPDGLDGRDDYQYTYPNDDDLEDDYAMLTSLFCRLIARQTVRVKISGGNTALKFIGDRIII